MKEVKHYVCEICNTEYNEKIKATECEKNHKKALKIKSARYLPCKDCKTGYPVSIEVEMEDGSVATYKR